MLRVVEEDPGQSADLPVRAIQVALGQRKELLLQGKRLQHQLSAIDVAAGETVPEAELASLQRKRIEAEANGHTPSVLPPRIASRPTRNHSFSENLPHGTI